MRKKILVIDDEVDIVDLLCKCLHAKKYDTVAAFNGEEGLSKFNKEMPDLVILDLNMPNMSGLEVCRIIRREQENDTPIIIVTGENTETDRIVGRVRGADIYMTKPFAPSAILDNIDILLQNRYRR